MHEAEHYTRATGGEHTMTTPKSIALPGAAAGEQVTLSLDAVISQLRDALLANQIFHTPIALRRRGGQWDEYEMDAIRRTREALASSEGLANGTVSDGIQSTQVNGLALCKYCEKEECECSDFDVSPDMGDK